MAVEHNELSNQDFFDLWQDTRFIGEEFLTWLWLASEVDSHFKLKDDLDVEVWFENSLKLESGSGKSRRQVTFQTAKETASHEWAEAFMAVMLAKKVHSGKLKVKTAGGEWSLVLPADSLCPKSIKVPPIADPGPGEADRGMIGQLLDRVVLLSELSAIIDALLAHFLELRLSPSWKTEELPRLRGWLIRWDKEARGQGAV